MRKKNCKPGKGFLKICCNKKAFVGERGKRKRALDDALGLRPCLQAAAGRVTLVVGLP